MAKFLVTFHRGDMAQDPASIADVRRAWVRWAAKTGPALADAGAPIRSTATLTGAGVSDGEAPGEWIGWSVIEATDRQTALRLLRDHPMLALGAVIRVSEPV